MGTFAGIVAFSAGLVVPGLGLVAIIGLISLICNTGLFILLTGRSYEIATEDFNENLKKFNDEEKCKFLDEVIDRVKFGSSRDDWMGGVRGEINNILTGGIFGRWLYKEEEAKHNIKSIFDCLSNQNQEISVRAARLIYTLLSQKEVRIDARFAVLNGIVGRMKREDSKKSLEKYFGEKILGKLKTLHKEILPQPPYEDYCQGYLSVLQKSEEDFTKKIEEIFNL